MDKTQFLHITPNSNKLQKPSDAIGEQAEKNAMEETLEDEVLAKNREGEDCTGGITGNKAAKEDPPTEEKAGIGGGNVWLKTLKIFFIAQECHLNSNEIFRLSSATMP